MKDKLQIINKFGLQVEEVEPTVYKVQNTDLEVNVNKLQWELEECILFTSERKRREKLENGLSTMIANVYYILLSYDNDELINKYDEIACAERENTYLLSYKYRPERAHSIDTIYGEDEI